MSFLKALMVVSSLATLSQAGSRVEDAQKEVLELYKVACDNPDTSEETIRQIGLCNPVIKYMGSETMEKCVNEYVGEGAGVKENFHKVCAMDVTQTLQYMRGVESCVVRELGPKKMEEFSDAVTQMEEEKSDEEIWEEEVQCYKNALGAQQ